MSVRSAVRAAAPAAAIFLLAGCLLALAYYHDNKYLSPPPYGADGVLELTDADLGRPVPLVDGWLLSVDGAPAAEAFIGQYSNFSFAPGGTSAFGSAVYELELRYDGDAPERALVLLVPEVYGDFTLYVDGAVAAAGGDGAQVGIVVRDGTRLELEVENREHYYSGLVLPARAGHGAGRWGSWTSRTRSATCVLVLGPLAAALLSFAVRRRGDGDALVGDFGVLCAGVRGGRRARPGRGVAAHCGRLVVRPGGRGVGVRARGGRGAGRPRRGPAVDAGGAPGRVRRTARALWAAAGRHVRLGGGPCPALPASIGAYGRVPERGAHRVAGGCSRAAPPAGAAQPQRRGAVRAVRLRGAGRRPCGEPSGRQRLRAAVRPVAAASTRGCMLVGVFAWMLAARLRRLRAAQPSRCEIWRCRCAPPRRACVHLRHGRSGEARTARHDLRHHVAALRRMTEEGAWERLPRLPGRAVAEQQDADAAPALHGQRWWRTRCMAAYLAPAQAAGDARGRCDVRVPERLGLGATELSVLLSNLLSNAVEACECARAAGAGRAVPRALHAHAAANVLALRCENSAVARRVVSGARARQNPREHGLGLPAMREIARAPRRRALRRGRRRPSPSCASASRSDGWATGSSAGQDAPSACDGGGARQRGHARTRSGGGASGRGSADGKGPLPPRRAPPPAAKCGETCEQP